MKKIYIIIILFSLLSLGSCKKFLDVNTNPNNPERVEANLYLSPMLHWMITAPTYDARFVGRYTQNWTLTSTNSTWDRQGYDPSSDNGGQVFRMTYFDFGQNLVDMNTRAEQEQRWDLLGVGQILKAWGWITSTDLHGEIIVKEAINPAKTTFAYDTQQYAYEESLRLLDAAIANLKRTDGGVNATILGKTDIIYKGDVNKWIKFANGLKAMILNHYSNKPNYKPDDVIALVDASFTSNADDALLAYTGTANDDINFYAAARDNLTSYRQTRFILSMLDGTVFTGTQDPRLTRMLSPAPDGVYRGLEPTFGIGALTAAQQPNNFWGYSSLALANASISTPSRYIFGRKSKLPAMTYAQLQFIKAEAAYKKGDKATALDAYTKGISAHIDFVNARNTDDGQSPTQISAAEKSAYLALPSVVPTSAAALTLSQIMCQKYIAQWGWGHLEQWTDLRRYHYTDKDPVVDKQVFAGFTVPTNLYQDNGGKFVYRIRPRYNSEYVWNRAELDKIGGLATDYHTKETWITLP
ncbi:SusD/RagB family nutrient-binding outer membrane lipoprotein [Pedobacter punctiformis]|uniref:SusD/RagB family nutrient-binding outer membrane lipoprotein n=1 Tax=Pedobacter punctiformis TaxID=3004097 RepID=A0ABT4L554_9SPHI|nr:SusD/RagB family nutrient-binding outer membrane lipoprotein [Pedobacter sp. HCMS5-2]MCZ4243046.1 SusD/RagB family nutrient-binding outer membrane lipoprotein [Pedobacter sp. HCMS5-2]